MRWSLALACLCLSCAFITSAYTSQPQWHKLILTFHWPQTFCAMENCTTDINYWAIHGLWPDKGDMCNKSLHFNESLIQDLLPEMIKFWPNLLNSSPSSTKFWKHEWQKHGTCAVTLEALNTEHKYFAKALELYHQVGLDVTLRNADILPGVIYTVPQIEQVIVQKYGVKPKIQCTHQKESQLQALGQIEICFSPEFQLMDCEKHQEPLFDFAVYWNTWSGYRVCDESQEVYYPPLP